MRSRLAAVLTALMLVCLAGVALADVLAGTEGNDTITGTAGEDSLYGRGGNDTLAGGAGNDTLDGGPGADDLRGDAGQDAVSYQTATAPLRVTLDDEAADGANGELDNVHADVEDLFGGRGSDALIGSPTANTLDGGAGDDTLVGGAGPDGLFGGDGDDTLNARDGGVDTVDCGPGKDTFIVDTADVVSNCETRARPPRVIGIVSHADTLAATYMIFRRLSIKDISEDGATVEVRCTGRGCPTRFRSFVVPDGTVPLNLNPLFRGRKLRLRTVIEFRILAPGRIGKVQRYTVGRKKLTSRSLCLEPGATTPSPC